MRIVVDPANANQESVGPESVPTVLVLHSPSASRLRNAILAVPILAVPLISAQMENAFLIPLNLERSASESPNVPPAKRHPNVSRANASVKSAPMDLSSHLLNA